MSNKEKATKISWLTLAFMAFSTVWGFGNITNGFEMCIRDRRKIAPTLVESTMPSSTATRRAWAQTLSLIHISEHHEQRTHQTACGWLHGEGKAVSL